MHQELLSPCTGDPVLAICGWKNSGKTTLLERTITHLRKRSLKVGVVKHDAHGIDVDRAGSDSDRLYQAGAAVVLQGPGEYIHRFRPSSADGLERAIHDLLHANDIVLVEGHKRTPLPKVWLASATEPNPPDEVSNLLDVLPWADNREARFLPRLERWLKQTWRRRPMLGGVLIGGRSRRMHYRPKQLLRFGGRSLLEIAVRALEPNVEKVVLMGSGEVPESCAHYPRLPDVRGVEGPLTGILAGFRWSPATAWCIASCDLPLVTAEAVGWVLNQRKPGAWAVLPRRSPYRIEPLLAIYEPQAHNLLEALGAKGEYSLQQLQAEDVVQCPSPPGHLDLAWRNVNTDEELRRLPRPA